MMKLGILALAIALGLPHVGAAEPIDFVRDVRPLFAKYCYGCHGAKQQKSGLRLDVKSEAFKGGESYAPNIIPGQASESPLVKFVAGQDKDMLMPPQDERLSAAEIAILTKWIDEGAVWPDGVDLAKLDDRRDHWSFKPLTIPLPPATRDTTWARQVFDGFVLAQLEKEHLRPAPEADRVTWLRRVSFDLTGLPPTPERVAEFVNDLRSDAYEIVVDELLNSPRYGERWAQHWLDVVRYADTDGFEVNTERPNSWPYRDYVIQAFNDDRPYDRFIREQIIGDALGQDAATGFLVTASVLLPGQIGADEPSKRLARQDSLDEIVVNIGQTFLGLSVGCARCHDHKFDPISQTDYYSMQAFVAGVEYADRPLRTPETEASRQQIDDLKLRLAQIEHQLAQWEPLALSGVERVSINPRQNNDRFAPVQAKRLRFTINATNNLEPCLDELEVFDTAGHNVALASAGTKVKSSGDRTAEDRHELRFVNDGNYGNSRSWMSNEQGRGWVELEFAAEHVISRVAWGRDRQGQFKDRLAVGYRIEVAATSSEWSTVADSADRRKYEPNDNTAPEFSTEGLSEDDAKAATALMTERTSIDGEIKAAVVGQMAFAGTFRKPDAIHLLNRGDPEQPKEVVEPAVLGLFGTTKVMQDAPELERRRTLADWIADPANPLTARVMVNRIWQGHFGTGLVETASDFGRNGTKPSHPELLDWLAQAFIRSGWSIKHMHRLIVLSATYRQSSRYNPVAAARDADARLLWRFSSRRLDAECIRDALLAASGRLNQKMGGPGFDLFKQRGGLSGFTPIESPSGDGLRRMIYAHKVRRERDAVFGAFDCPDAGQSTAQRRESTTPIQALNLFNSRFTIGESDAFASRVNAEVGDDVAKQVRRAYQLTLSRDPSLDEIAEAEPVVREYGLSTLGRALFNSNEFLSLP
jgi:mono/diheme cytochrome c family protein